VLAFLPDICDDRGMTRKDIQKRYPDTYAFFDTAPDEHPFWVAMGTMTRAHFDENRTLLPDLEQVFSSLHMVDGHERAKQHLLNVTTHDELMRVLTKLYVAYLYRNHGVKMVHEDGGYDIELEIADQLLALGIVDFHSFEAPELQFGPQIEGELAYLAEMKKRQQTDPEDRSIPDFEIDETKTQEFIDALQVRATGMKEHPNALHQVLVVITHHTLLPRQVAIMEHIAKNPERMAEQFPHLSGVLLVDPEAGNEKATYIPFHGHDASDLEMLLNKIH
jgi:hypothetical protein